MHAFAFGHVSVLEIVLAVLWALGCKAAVMETPDIEQMLAQAVTDALHAAHISIQEAAYAMRMGERQLRQQLACEKQQHISLTRLIRMPFTFWLHFSPSLMAVIYRKRMQEFAASFNDMKRGA